jgi:hypothetical protein
MIYNFFRPRANESMNVIEMIMRSKIDNWGRPYRVDEMNLVYVQFTTVHCLDLSKWIMREYLKLG